MINQRTKGRMVPERIIAAETALLANIETVSAYASSLPDRVALNDGRVLRLLDRGDHNVGYAARDGLKVIVSLDPTPHGLLRHVSASYCNRLPSWADLRLLRDAFFPPDIDVIQVLPRSGQYINFHSYCLHLFESPGEWQGGLFV